jgi:hypothetical protein
MLSSVGKVVEADPSMCGDSGSRPGNVKNMIVLLASFAAPRAPAQGATFLRPAPSAPLPTLPRRHRQCSSAARRRDSSGGGGSLPLARCDALVPGKQLRLGPTTVAAAALRAPDARRQTGGPTPSAPQTAAPPPPPGPPRPGSRRARPGP